MFAKRWRWTGVVTRDVDVGAASRVEATSSPRRGRWRRRLIALLVTTAVVVTAIVAVRLTPHTPLRDWQPRSVAVTDREGKLMRLTLARDERYRLWTPLEHMPPALREAVLLQEDQWFARHPGFNPMSLVRGAWETYIAGGARQGGSTITMQLARLLWRLDTRGPAGKLVQITRAVQLEIWYSKNEILEAYLNYAPYGGNIEGVGAAARIYFDKAPRDLSLPESLTLAVLPQDPSRRVRAHAGAAPLGDGLREARDRLFVRWQEKHPATPAITAQFALPLELRATRGLPFAAPHFVNTLLGESLLRGEPEDGRLVSTIDTAMQTLVEQRVAQYLKRTRRRGLDNAAVMLVDTRNMAVRASLGSADYFDAAIAGQVDGTRAKRSPGSTLKPFIYALGVDQGVLHPATVLRDVPSAFGPFSPENFDGRFVGPISASEALVRSRNVPAVWVASQLTTPSFHDFLRRAQISRLASESHYGLALVLGGGEVTMAELARLYAMLGNDGVLKPLRRLESDRRDPGTALISAEAAYLVRDMLHTNERPDIGAAAARASSVPIAWKTGTSWGFRDAWTAGVVGPYVLVVWMGNFDGSGNPALVGVDAAAPLFFEIVDALAAGGVSLADPPRRWPLNLARVSVCRASGELPNAWCPQRGETWFVPGKSPIRVSTVHRALAIDVATGLPACASNRDVTTRQEIYEYWPSELARVFAQAGIPRRKPPVNPACPEAGQRAGTPPRIESPMRGTTYTMRLNRPENGGIALHAEADADVRAVYWFVDDAFVARSAPGLIAQWLPRGAGRYRIRAVDDHGRADTREVEVAQVQ
jgi:penicillin-binding protein 1C